jgi:magnesium transporter
MSSNDIKISYINLTDNLKDRIKDYIDNTSQNKKQILSIVKQLHYSDIASFISELNFDRKTIFLNIFYQDIDPLFLTKFHDLVLEEIVDILGSNVIAKLLSNLESSEVLDIIEDLDKNLQEEILEIISQKIKEEVEIGLTYDDDAAGRYMNREFLSVNKSWSISKIKEFLIKNKHHITDDLLVLFVIDHLHQPQGLILISDLFKYNDDDLAQDIMHNNFYKVNVDCDIDTLISLFKKYSLKSLAVTDKYNHMIGIINLSNVVELIDESAEEDILHLGGITDPDLFASINKTFKQRLPWLGINLVTAIIASIVIGIFDESIEKLVALAILMPIIASMGGNAGTQSVTIAVRALATQELTSENYLRVIAKESLLGLINGLIFGAFCMACIYYFFNNLNLALLFAFATTVTLTIAGLSGSVIPIIIHKYKSDPAISSGVILTTITDVVAFMVFLGFANFFIF